MTTCLQCPDKRTKDNIPRREVVRKERVEDRDAYMVMCIAGVYPHTVEKGEKNQREMRERGTTVVK